MSWRTRAPAVKRLLASASLGATSAGIGTLALEGGRIGPALGVAALVGVAAVGLTRRSVMAQVLSRGIAWVVLTPMLLGLADALGHGRWPDPGTAFFAATSAGALLLGRPALHTDAAKAEFSPVAYRRIFLAGAVASVMTGTVMAFFAAVELLWHVHRGFALAALAAALLATAVGVVRMRAWGVLLGIVTSTVALGVALLSTDVFAAVGLALAAVPGLVLASPLVAARLRKPAPAAAIPGGVRLAADVHVEADVDAGPPVFARIAAPAEAEVAPLLPASVTRRT